LRKVEAYYALTQTNFNRFIASRDQFKAAKEEYANGTTSLDLYMSAQQGLANAEIEYYNNLTNYTLAISNVHFFKGSYLEYNGVHLAEGPWPAKAYFDARRRARARDAAMYLDYGFTYPSVMSRGPVVQNAGTVPSSGTPQEAAPEPVPTPAAEPAGKTPAPAGRPLGSSAMGVPPGPALQPASGLRPAGQFGAPLRPLPDAQGRSPVGSGQWAVGSGQPAVVAPEPSSYVQAAAYRQPMSATGVSPVPGGALPVAGGSVPGLAGGEAAAVWKHAGGSGGANEPVADLPSAATYQPAAGWKGTQQ
jgi:hypothetical protein